MWRKVATLLADWHGPPPDQSLRVAPSLLSQFHCTITTLIPCIRCDICIATPVHLAEFVRLCVKHDAAAHHTCPREVRSTRSRDADQAAEIMTRARMLTTPPFVNRTPRRLGFATYRGENISMGGTNVTTSLSSLRTARSGSFASPSPPPHPLCKR